MGQRVHGGAEKGFGGAGAARLLGHGRGGCGVETGCRGHGVLKGGVPMISEVGYGRESPEITAVISAWLVGARGGSGDDGADQRGLGVSERGARAERVGLLAGRGCGPRTGKSWAGGSCCGAGRRTRAEAAAELGRAPGCARSLSCRDQASGGVRGGYGR